MPPLQRGSRSVHQLRRSWAAIVQGILGSARVIRLPPFFPSLDLQLVGLPLLLDTDEYERSRSDNSSERAQNLVSIKRLKSWIGRMRPCELGSRLVDSPVFDVCFLVEHGDLHVEDEPGVVAQLADERGTGF